MLDLHTRERLVHCHIADSHNLAEQLRTIERIEKGRRQVDQLRSTPWVMRLLRSLAMRRIDSPRTIQRQ